MNLKYKNIKRAISLLLLVAMLITGIPVSFAEDEYMLMPEVFKPVEFKKAGEVRTIVNNYNLDFYVLTEYFDSNFEYYSPKVETRITKEEFEKYYKGKAYDKVNIKLIANDENKSTMLDVEMDKNGSVIDTSYAGEVVSGNFADITIDGTTETFSWVLNNKDKYYNVSSNVKTGKSIFTQITDIEYEKVLFDKKYMFHRIIKETVDGTITNYEETNYDYTDKIIGTPTIIKKDSTINVAELFYVISALSSMSEENKTLIYGVEELAKKINEYSKTEEETTDVGDYVLTDEMINKYEGLYTNWMDEFNRGYIGIWLDPYFSGKKTVIEWNDPFWANSEIKHTTETDGIEYGYYDDAGNYIKLDSSGNPIPKEPGSFDSAGNFKPVGSSGYYDPNGIYHPMFNHINGVFIDFDGRFNIDGEGYFSKSGILHEKAKDMSTFVIYDGRLIHSDGTMENQLTGSKLKIKRDVWGRFFYSDEVIYPDFSVFNVKTNTLKLADGTTYLGEIKGTYVLFGNNDAIHISSLAKGKKDTSAIVLSNGSRILDSGVYQYPNGITYFNGEIRLPNGQVINEKFEEGKDSISVGSYGLIYSNLEFATYNEFGDLISSSDAVIISDVTILETGNMMMNGAYYEYYIDGKGNIAYTNGYVLNRNLQLGVYDLTGTFVSGLESKLENGYYDYIGNFISYKGEVKRVVNDPSKPGNKIEEIGYYNENGKFDKLFTNPAGSYYTANGVMINFDGKVEKKENLYGYYDEELNFTMNSKNGFFDKDGTFSQTSNNVYFSFNKNGLIDLNTGSKFTKLMNGKIGILGSSDTYDENGMVNRNGDLGYYDESGIFIISKENPYIGFGYFYDSYQSKHNVGTIYKSTNGSLNLLSNPNIGLHIKDDKLMIFGDEHSYGGDGIVSVDGANGYFNQSGVFTKSNSSPYIGGFYTSEGLWVDFNYYSVSSGKVYLNSGGFNRFGNYITPSGDIGSFDSDGVFKLNISNLNKEFFFDKLGRKTSFDKFYIDSLGFFNNLNGIESYDVNGNLLSTVEYFGYSLEGYVMIEPGMFMNSLGEIGHFEKDNKFILGSGNYKAGFYMPDGTFVDYGTESTMGKYKDIEFLNKGMYRFKNDTTEVLVTASGYAYVIQNKAASYSTLSSGLSISNAGEVGTVSNEQFSKIESSAKGITKTISGKYLDFEDNFGYFESNGTFVSKDGDYGYYKADGKFVIGAVNPYRNGFFNFNGIWTSFDGTTIPNKGYFNEFGIFRNGENPYKTGYYDNEGSFHPFGKDYFITIDGNVFNIGENAIGYKNTFGQFFPYGDDGYFDIDGTYYKDGTLVGYFNKDGSLNKGKNSSFDGFHDKKGNWHIFGDKGYYNESGFYYTSVNDETIGYFNEVGEFTKGFNPYVNGFNDINGNWNNINSIPMTAYFDKDGRKMIGTNPYADGFYDMYSNWHQDGTSGYYDKSGTYFSVSTGSIGYYDKKGNYREGTNPYQHGFFDEDANLRIFGHEGYFTKNGTFVDSEENLWYFTADSQKKRGENVSTAGFYDSTGNFYPFEEDGYKTKDGLLFPTILMVDKYKVGSSNYILFEGIFNNPEYVPSSSKNTLQFTFQTNSGAPIYIDTGIRVSKNAMISYSNAKDLVHSIAVYSKSSFISDKDSSIIVIGGRIVNLVNEGRISVKELRDKFLDSNITIDVKPSRVGKRMALAESIEYGKDITLYSEGKKIKLNNELIVNNDIPYISLKDITDVIAYTSITNKSGENRVISFKLKETAESYLLDSLPVEYVNTIGDTELFITNQDETYSYAKLKAPIITKTNSASIEEIYVPIYMLTTLSGKNVEFNTVDYKINIIK